MSKHRYLATPKETAFRLNRPTEIQFQKTTFSPVIVEASNGKCVIIFKFGAAGRIFQLTTARDNKLEWTVP